MDSVSDIVIGVVRLLVLVSAGVFAGSILEATGWMKRVGFLVRPLTRFGRLPSTCGSAFLTAFLSPRAANSMLAGGYSDNRLGRYEMITGALVNVLPNTLAHLRILAFAVIPLLGGVGVAYIGFQIGVASAVSLIVLTVARVFSGKSREEGVEEEETGADSDGESESWRMVFRRSAERTKRILTRIMLITVPIYVLVAILDHAGVFRQAAEHMPEALVAVLPPASIAVIAAHMSSVMNAAGVAAEFLHSASLSGLQVFMTLVAGYVLSMPVRAVRHAIPAAVGIFPPRDGVIIVVISLCLRAAIGIGVFSSIWIYAI